MNKYFLSSCEIGLKTSQVFLHDEIDFNRKLSISDLIFSNKDRLWIACLFLLS